MCERELETEQNCNILTPTLTAIRVFLSRSELLNRGPGGPLCWMLVFSTASYLQLVELPVHSYIIIRRPPFSCGRHKSHSFNPSTVEVIFWYSSTGFTCYLHRSISYFNSPVNIQHFYQPCPIFSCEISLVCCLKCPYSCFSSHFCFLIILFCWCLCCLYCFCSLYSVFIWIFLCNLRVFVSMHRHYLQCWRILFLLFFLDTYRLSSSSLWCKVLCIVMSFLVLWSICWSSFLAHL